MISTNGIDWTVHGEVAMPAPVNALTSGGGRFVAVGEKHFLWTEDGVAWHVARTNQESFFSVDYVNGLFLAASARSGFQENGKFPGEKIGLSTDGENWSFLTLPPVSRHALYSPSVAYGNGVFVYVASSVHTFSTTNQIREIANAPELIDVIFTDRFIGVGLSGIFQSSNGIDWTQVSPYPGTSIAFGGGHYVAYRPGGVTTSTDGLTWSPAFLTGESFPAIAFGDGRFVTAASSNLQWSSEPDGESVLLTSANGRDWSIIDPKPTAYLGALSYVQGAFLGLQFGGKGIASRDGLSWEHFDTGLPGMPRALAFQNGEYCVALGERVGRFATQDSGFVAQSRDGRAWSVVSTIENHELRGIAMNGQTRVAVGIRWSGKPIDGIILVSTDGGGHWKEIPSQHGLYAITYGENKFVAVGNAGHVVISRDGAEWRSSCSGDM